MSQRRCRRGFTIVELIVVVGVVLFLAGIILAALAGVRTTGKATDSMSRMRQVATWMHDYSSSYRDFIVPARFDYSANPHTGKIRSEVTIGNQFEGTWTDILWTLNEVHVFPEVASSLGHNYRTDSPDQALYDEIGGFDANPFRSAVSNTVNTPGGDDLPKPFGLGALDQGDPGYFAANSMFDTTAFGPNQKGGWVTSGQISVPDKSLYLVDSFAGEVIGDPSIDGSGIGTGTGFEVPFDVDAGTAEVDFRYGGSVLILFLDGHTQMEEAWETLDDLQDNRKIRVTDLF